MMQSNSEVISAPGSVYLLAENRLLRETLARVLAKRVGLGLPRRLHGGVAPLHHAARVADSSDYRR
jgi:hypothetical protein